MKHSILSFLLFILLLNFTSAQTAGKYTQADNGFILTLTFESEPYLLEGDSKNIINYFQVIDESIPGLPVFPSKTIFVAMSPESKVRLSFINEKHNYVNNIFPKGNPEVKLRTDSTLLYKDNRINSAHIKSEFYPHEKYFIEGYTWIRDYYCAVIRINTHRYNWEKRQVSELTEAKIKFEILNEKPFSLNTLPHGDFDESLDKIILNYPEAKNYRSFQPNFALNDSTGNWIDYTKEYVKLAIPDNSIYRIDYNDIISYGISPQSVDPQTFKVFSKGEEIPLYVFGEDDNSFDPVDYIEFWAEKNYGYPNYRNLVMQGEDYLPFLDIYSDTLIVWLTWDGDNGKRATEINNYVPGLTDSVSSHLVKIHLEKDNLFWYYGFVLPRIQLPFWHECKTWIWQQVTNTGTSSFPFIANSVVPNTQVYTISRLNSWFSDGLVQNAHKYGAKMNSTVIQDSVIFDFETIANLEAVFNSSDLIEGTNNYRIAGMPNDSGKTHKALLDWADIEYCQFTNAVNDSLLIRIPDSVSTQLRAIKVSNFNSDSSSTIIYKINSVRKRVSAFMINGTTLTFTDTVKGGDKYFVITNGYLKQPVFIKKKEFINLRNPNRQADYILITHNGLQPSAIDYSNFIETDYNLNAETIFVEDIYDEFAYGYLKPEPIKSFLEYAYFNWQSPKPSYLTLLGDCTYDYKNLFTSAPTPRKQILVPSYGQPVSDSWFTMWDTVNVNVQQMLVGRIPANNNEEVYRYLEKHQTYLQRGFDEWNKSFLLFSGGFFEYPSELEQIKQANNRVLTNIIQPAPVGGEAIHFYKTISPPTNLGPYTPEEIQAGLDKSGLFISYVGHSGTRTWDNGITEPSDIKNAFNDRFPVISDNGCSTGKFAEPDIDAFGELFVSQDESGQAISYLGNSSLGYTSTAYRMPEVFYKRLVVDSSMSIGEAHFLAKMDNFNQAGFGDVNRVYNYCNILLGDPVIKVASPDKANFVVNKNSIKFNEDFVTDNSDSTDIKIVPGNWGRVVSDSLEVDIEGTYSDSTIYSYHLLRQSPLFHDTLNLRIPVLGLAGEHKIKVELDKDNLVDEFDENDNAVEVSFIVYSTKLRPIEPELFYNSSRSTVRVLNPTIRGGNLFNEIELALSQSPDFSNQVSLMKNLDTVATSIQLNSLLPDTRYYWRARLNGAGQEWSQTVSFFNNYDHSWIFNHSFNPEDVVTEKVEFDSVTNGWKLTSTENILKVSSAGSNDGEYGSMQYNFQEVLPVTFYWGIATAVIDSATLEPSDFKYFLYWDPNPADSMNNYLNSLPDGTIVAMTICADGSQAVFTRPGGSTLRQTIKNYGSIYVDSVQYRDSWAIIGIKGAPQGSVPEDYAKRLQGSAATDTSKFVQYLEGTIQFPIAENSVNWLNVIKNDSVPSGAAVNYYPIAYKNDGEIDTLNMLQFISNEASLGFIDNDVYKKISIFAELLANSESESPEIKEIAINFVPPPELGINYQVVSISEDSVMIGEDITLKFYVYNVGETTADSVKVRVEIVREENTREIILEQVLDSLISNDKKYFEVTYNTSSGSGTRTFFINIDPSNEVDELFEDNNFFSVPFYVEPDTSSPTLNVTFDGNDILDGEYISASPQIKIELNDQSLLPINDLSSVMIYLNDEFVPSDTSILSYEFSETNPKVIVDFTPSLDDGEYFLRVLGNNGNQTDTASAEKLFLVSSEAKILHVYNYPNPFRNETHFTFKLTQIPDQIKIKIFTIAGRLIRELNLASSELKFDFNKIYWDGKDEDGDEVANGVYLYKVIMKAGDKTETVTQKLAVVR